MRVKIISDGTSTGTRIFDCYTGEPIEGVKTIRWGIDASGIATATIVVDAVPVEIVGEA